MNKTISYNDLMIMVSKCNTIREFYPIIHYFHENHHHYSDIEINFAEEFLSEKMTYLANKLNITIDDL